MVGYTPGEKELSHGAYVTAGALSGVLTRACIQPIDVLKIRFQVGHERQLCTGVCWLLA